MADRADASGTGPFLVAVVTDVVVGIVNPCTDTTTSTPLDSVLSLAREAMSNSAESHEEPVRLDQFDVGMGSCYFVATLKPKNK